MNEQGVWRKINRSEMSSGRRCVKHKWVFNIKRNGIFRARLVACGYSQIPGVDFNEVYSPVANDMTFRMLLVQMMIHHYSSLMFDVEVAFLHGKLNEEIFMDCPKGMDARPDECLLLIKTLYGLVQSSRQYFKTFKSTLIDKMGFEDCPCDPCLFKKQDKNGICYVVCYVDDNLCIGDEKAIRAVVEEIPKHGLAVTVTENMDDYLSCQVLMNKDKTKAWVGQPHMVKKIINTFEDEVKGLQIYKTPGTPNKGLILAKEDEDRIDEARHSRYRTGTGMLLYCIKHSRPEISNAVRELSKCLSGPNEAAYKEMLRIIKYVKDTPDIGLRMEPQISEEWNVEVFTDSD
jgi:hypothetical protein